MMGGSGCVGKPHGGQIDVIRRELKHVPAVGRS